MDRHCEPRSPSEVGERKGRERDRLFKRVAAVVLREEITVASLHKWTLRAPLAAFRRNMQDGTGD